MSFHALNKTVTSVPMYFGGNAPVGKLLDLVAQEQRGLAIDTVSGKILIRDRDNPAIDRLVDINPADPADSIFTYSGSQKFITRENGNMELTAVGEIPLNHKYNAATGLYEPLGILIEPQKTNLMLHNKSTVSWAERTEDGPHATLRYVQTNAADFKGRMIAKKLVPSTSSALQRIYKVVGNINSGATEKLCYQCFFKAGGYSKVQLQNSENEGVTIDLLDDSNAPFGNTVNSGNGYGSENQGDGWWFAWVVFDHPNTDTGDVPWIQILDDTGASTFAGNGTDGIYFYGDQLTVGDHPTSLIETDSSTVTRLADDLSLALPFWNNDGMTVIAEFEYYGDPVGTTYGRAGGLVFAVTKTGESVFLNQWVVGRYIGDVYGISRSDQTGVATSAAVATVNDVMLGNGPFKMAFSFDNTEQQLALNGGAFVSTTNNNVVLQDATTLNLSHAYNGAVGQKRLKSLIVVPRTWTQTEMLQGSQL